jgi:hypothetical protein
MRKQTTFVITAAILLTAIVSIVLYNVKTTNAQGNMTAAGAAKNMTSAMSTVGKAMNQTK